MRWDRSAATFCSLWCLGLGLVAACARPGAQGPRPPASTERPATPLAGSGGPTAGSATPPFPRACTGASCFQTRDGFRYLHPLPQGRTLESVVALGEGAALAVGDGATVLHAKGGRLHPVDVPGVRSLHEAFRDLQADTPDPLPGAEHGMPRFGSIVPAGPDELILLLDRGRLARFAGGAWSSENAPPFATFGDRLFGARTGLAVVTPDLLAALLGSGPAPLVRASGAWRRGGAMPARRPVRSGAVRGESVWFGSDAGVILRSDRGAPFVVEPLDPPTKHAVEAMSLAPDGDQGFAATGDAEVYERTGQRWTQRGRIEDGPAKLFDIRALWTSPDGSETWAGGTQLFHKVGDTPFRHVPLPAWAGTSGGPVSWQEGPHIHAIDGRARDDVFFAGRFGALFHWDGHALRELGRRETEARIVGVLPTTSGGWLAVAADGTVIQGNGIETSVAARVPTPVSSARVASDGAILVMSPRDDLFVWERDRWVPRPRRAKLYGLAAATSEDELFHVGADGEIVRSTLTGTETIASGVRDDLRAMAAAGKRSLWIVGGAVILQGDGARFTVAHRGQGEEYRAIAARGPDDVWIAGSSSAGDGLVLHWNGRVFERFERVHDEPLVAIDASRAGTVCATGRSGGVALFDGSKWTAPATNARSLDVVHVDTRGTIIAGGEGGVLVALPSAAR